MAIKLTVNDRILLHLLEFTKYKSQSEVPFEVTQSGIAQTVGIHLSHIPRSMKQLTKDGLTIETTAHVQLATPSHHQDIGVTGRKRKAYFLTHTGIKLGKSLESKLNSHKFTYRNLKGQTTTKKLSEILKSLKDSERDGIVAVYNFIATTGQGTEFDHSKWREQLGGMGVADTARGYSLVYPKILDKLPRFDNFHGRERELKALKKLVDAAKIRLILISGERGIGKSALVAKALESYRDSVNIFWCDTRGTEMLDDTLTELAKLLSMAKRRSFSNYLGKSTKSDVERAIEILQDEFQGMNTILIINNTAEVGHANLILNNFIGFLQDLLGAIPDLKAIIASRPSEQLAMGLGAKLGAGQFQTLEVGGLAKSAGKAVLENCGSKVRGAEFEAIYHHTGGNPLFLELIANVKLEPKVGDEQYSAEERALLKYLRVVEQLSG